MALVKISQLPPSANLNSNPNDSYFVTVDGDTLSTTKISAKAVGTTLYANNELLVGTGGVALTNVIAQFTGSDPLFLQTSVQNLDSDGSSDYVVTADDGTNNSFYLDLGYNNSTYSDPDYSATGPHDGYLYVHGPLDHTGNEGNLVLGTVALAANIVFTAGGLQTANIVSRFNRNSITFLKDVYINGANVINGGVYKFSDGTQQQTAAIKSDYITSSFSVANSAYTAANSGLDLADSSYAAANAGLDLAGSAYDSANAGVDLAGSAFNSANAAVDLGGSAYDSANAGVDLAGSAYEVANNALPKAGGTATGDYIFNGQLNQNNIFIVANSTFDSTNSSLVQIIGSAGGAIRDPSNPGYMLQVVGIDGVPSRIINTGYGTNAYALFAGRHANGTAESPTAAANNDVLARYSASGYTGTSFTPTGQGRIDIVADENFNSANQGSRIEFWNTNRGANSLAKIATFNANSASFTGVVNPQKGFLWTPNVITSDTTSLTINFAKDSLIKCNSTGGINITLTNMSIGRETIVWFYNSAGSTQTVTHGCFSNNSTVDSTTVSASATSVVYMRYFCFGPSLSDVFVSVSA